MGIISDYYFNRGILSVKEEFFLILSNTNNPNLNFLNYDSS